MFLVAKVNSKVVKTVISSYNKHRKSAYYLSVHPKFRKRKIANALLNQLKKKLIARSCPKIQINVPKNNNIVLKMYKRLKYKHANVLSLSKRLIKNKKY